MVQQPHIDEYQKQKKKNKTKKQKYSFACKSSLQKPYFEKKKLKTLGFKI